MAHIVLASSTPNSIPSLRTYPYSHDIYSYGIYIYAYILTYVIMAYMIVADIVMTYVVVMTCVAIGYRL